MIICQFHFIFLYYRCILYKLYAPSLQMLLVHIIIMKIYFGILIVVYPATIEDWDSESEAFGLKSKYILVHPFLLLLCRWVVIIHYLLFNGMGVVSWKRPHINKLCPVSDHAY